MGSDPNTVRLANRPVAFFVFFAAAAYTRVVADLLGFGSAERFGRHFFMMVVIAVGPMHMRCRVAASACLFIPIFSVVSHAFNAFRDELGQSPKS